jgi:arabinofuranosyltransferase
MRVAMARPALRLVASALLVLLLSFYSLTALNRTKEFDYILRGMDEGLWIWREIGWWMADHTTPEESIAVTGAGAIAFYGQRTTIDMLGLTDRYIARVEVPDMGAGPAGHEKRAPDYVLNVRRPTYIPYMWSDYFPSEAYLAQDYEIVTITTRYGRELLMWRRRQS